MGKTTYKDAGVDLERYEQAMQRLPYWLHRTYSPRVIPSDGGFAGLFQLDFFQNNLFNRRYQQPVLVSGTDGVGTKLKVAQLTQTHHTVGIDLVAMCANDVICCGAEPLFFLDYIAMSEDDPELLERLVEGISNGCLQADCALLGGETAIMPDLYQKGDYDLAGFCVGVVDRSELIDGSAIAEGDVVIGVGSSGLHSNGFSLARKIVFDLNGLGIDDRIEELDATVGELLLTPTQIYSKPVRRALLHYKVKQVIHGIAHITGGGLSENLTRILPPHVQVNLRHGSWTMPPVFPWLQAAGDVDEQEMYRVFNMGIGLVLMISPYYADKIRSFFEAADMPTYIIGDITSGTADSEKGSVRWIE